MRKWSIDSQRKGKFNENIRQLEREVEGHDNTCMFTVDRNGNYCRQPAIACHSIPRKSVLMKLRDPNGSLLEFQWNMSAWRDVWNRNSSVDLNSPALFNPRKTGISKASVAKFACRKHDGEFNPIDVARCDDLDDQGPFLTAYRIVLFVNDLWRKYGVFLYNRARTTIEEHNNPYIAMKWRQLVNARQTPDRVLRSHTDKLGRIWYSGRGSYNKIEERTLHFRSQLRFAAAVMIGFTSPYVTVYPGENDSHSMTISYHWEDKPSVQKHVDRFEKLTYASLADDKYGVEIVNKIMSDGFGSVVASPRSYVELTDEQRETMQGIVRNLSQADLLDGIFRSRDNPASTSLLRRLSGFTQRFKL